METSIPNKTKPSRGRAKGALAAVALLVSLLGGLAATGSPADAHHCRISYSMTGGTGWYNLGGVSGSHYDLSLVPNHLEKKPGSPYGLRNQEKETRYVKKRICGSRTTTLGNVTKVDFRARQCTTIYVSGGGKKIPTGVYCGNTPWINFPEITR